LLVAGPHLELFVQDAIKAEAATAATAAEHFVAGVSAASPGIPTGAYNCNKYHCFRRLSQSVVDVKAFIGSHSIK